MQAKKITTETITLADNTRLVLREDSHGVTVEHHTPQGVFDLGTEIITKVRTFGGPSFNPNRPSAEQMQGRAKRVSTPASSPPAQSNGKKAAQRYTMEQKQSLLEGFRNAPNKSQFARENHVMIDTLRRWESQARSAK